MSYLERHVLWSCHFDFDFQLHWSENVALMTWSLVILFCGPVSDVSTFAPCMSEGTAVSGGCKVLYVSIRWSSLIVFVSTSMVLLSLSLTCWNIPETCVPVWLWTWKFPLEILIILHHTMCDYVAYDVQFQKHDIFAWELILLSHVWVIITPNQAFALKFVWFWNKYNHSTFSGSCFPCSYPTPLTLGNLVILHFS